MNYQLFFEIFISLSIGFLVGFCFCRLILIEQRHYYEKRTQRLKKELEEKDKEIEKLKKENTHLTFEHIYRVEPISAEDALKCDFSQNW